MGRSHQSSVGHRRKVPFFPSLPEFCNPAILATATGAMRERRALSASWPANTKFLAVSASPPVERNAWRYRAVLALRRSGCGRRSRRVTVAWAIVARTFCSTSSLRRCLRGWRRRAGLDAGRAGDSGAVSGFFLARGRRRRRAALRTPGSDPPGPGGGVGESAEAPQPSPGRSPLPAASR